MHRRIDSPHRVLHVVWRREVIQRLTCDDLLHDAIDGGGGAVNQEHRTGLRAECEQMSGAVVLFVLSRPLVLLDHVAVVLIEREAGGHTGLRTAAHPQAGTRRGGSVLNEQRRVASSAARF